MNPINYFTGRPDIYNSDFFDNISDAAAHVAWPFLVQQQNIELAGALINGTTVTYNNLNFQIYTSYINPSYKTPEINTYFVPTPPAFETVWPSKLFPNALFTLSEENTGAGSFRGTLDCVGFGCRVIIATGGNQLNTNAYAQLKAQIDINAIHFAATGIVPSALELAIAWPVLNSGRWNYIAGAIDVSAIQDNQNQVSATLTQPQKNYTGQSMGGFGTGQGGDILSFGYTAGHSNGHFMVLTDAPQKVLRETIPGLLDIVTQVYRISVYDSTDFGGSLHYNDSRTHNSAISCGIGYGELYILANQQDEPVGFVFGPNESAHYVGNPTQTDELFVAAITLARFQ